jgi:hypothetical protein
MTNDAINTLSDFESFGPCGVCGAPSNTLAHDLVVTTPLDSPGTLGKGSPVYSEHRFCPDHSREAKVTFVRESGEAYFARLRASEGAEI